MAKKNIDKWQFGDFQTPFELSRKVVDVLIHNHDIQPGAIIEPSCGKGSFILSCIDRFPGSRIVGYDVNPDYVAYARTLIPDACLDSRVKVRQGDFFNIDWNALLDELPGSVLVLGNPPWVTSSELGMLNSTNLPDKCNFQGRRGIEAITGAGNFDISEWMLLRHVDWLSKRDGAIAVLCKYSVARKVMRHVRETEPADFFGHIYCINAKKHFNACVEACLFVLTKNGHQADCDVYDSLETTSPSYTIGERDGYIVRNVGGYERNRNIVGQDLHYAWRSGLKHDCSKVMEIKPNGAKYCNSLGEQFALESDYVYPLLKGSDVGNGRTGHVRKYVIVPQKIVGESTLKLKKIAPLTWHYLQEHRSYLDGRRSSIYRGKPPFSIFGIGEYTFSMWKVAISCLYKHLEFGIVGPIDGKPVMFDDTVAFLSCTSQQEAEFLRKLLVSGPANEILNSMIFWDEKRPITVSVLRRVSIKALADALGCLEQYLDFVHKASREKAGQLSLGIAEEEAGYRTENGRTIESITNRC